MPIGSLRQNAARETTLVRSARKGKAMKLMVEMPEVSECTAEDCAYNMNKLCHARAITVGDEAGCKCDTMLKSQAHISRSEPAGVGACRVIGCMHNEDFLCQADGIRVDVQGRKADCMTFQPL